MPNNEPNPLPNPAPPHGRPAARPEIAGLVIRALEPGDLSGFAELMALPKVRWGTRRLPLQSQEQYRKWLESPEARLIVAGLDGRIVGCADVTRDKRGAATWV